MIRKVTLVISHEGSGSSELCKSLDRNPRVQWCRSNLIYDHPFILEQIMSIPHKLNNSAAIWMEELLYNFYFTHKRIYEMCRFIYVIREPRSSVNPLYYTYRLRRMCEMARKTPGAVLLTYDDIITGRGFPLLEEYLCLKESIMPVDAVKSDFLGSSEAQKSYERYFYYLKNLNLRKFV